MAAFRQHTIIIETSSVLRELIAFYQHPFLNRIRKHISLDRNIIIMLFTQMWFYIVRQQQGQSYVDLLQVCVRMTINLLCRFHSLSKPKTTGTEKVLHIFQ